jgi:hypothetical protein
MSARILALKLALYPLRAWMNMSSEPRSEIVRNTGVCLFLGQQFFRVFYFIFYPCYIQGSTAAHQHTIGAS